MNGADWPMTFLPRGRALRSEQPGFPCPRSPQSTGKGPTQCSSCHDSSHILPSRPHMARRFLMGSMWPEGLHRSLASHRLRISGPQSSAARRYLGSIPHTVATGRRVPPGSPGTHSHCAPSGLLPLQWLDRSPVHTEGRLGRVNHHDGGGWLLHPLCRALTLSPEAGSLPVPPDWGQLPAGPRGVFPGHLQQQDLPERRLICCPRSLPGELVLLPLLPLAQPFLSTCLLSCTFCGCLTQWLCPAQTWGGSCPCFFLLPQQPAVPST